MKPAPGWPKTVPLVWRRRLFWVALGAAPLVLLARVSEDWGVLAAILWAAVFVVAARYLLESRCPHCGERFYRPESGSGSPLRDRCIHCSQPVERTARGGTKAVVLGLAIGAAPPALATSPEVSPSPGTFFTHLQDGEINELAEAFRYPDGYSPQERQQEVAMVRKALAVLLHEFGGVELGELLPSPPPHLLTIGIAPGNKPTPDQTALATVAIRARFEKLGEGGVVLSLDRSKNRLGIVGLDFGLPAEDPAARATLERIATELKNRLAQK